ncbi:hypothetical protein [Arenimonas alkanexedens]
MKNVRAIRGLALTSLASLGLIAVTPAFAESDFATGNGALTTSADLQFQVIIPRFISFRVGTAGATVDSVDFTVAAANVGTGTAVARTNAAGAPISVSLLSNVGDVNLSAAGSGTGLVLGGVTIPWAQISGTSSNAAQFPVPGIGAAATSLTAANGVIARSADWTFQYANANTYAAGTYVGTVTYTAATP